MGRRDRVCQATGSARCSPLPPGRDQPVPASVPGLAVERAPSADTGPLGAPHNSPPSPTPNSTIPQHPVSAALPHAGARHAPAPGCAVDCCTAGVNPLWSVGSWAGRPRVAESDAVPKPLGTNWVGSNGRDKLALFHTTPPPEGVRDMARREAGPSVTVTQPHGVLPAGATWRPSPVTTEGDAFLWLPSSTRPSAASGSAMSWWASR